MKISKHTTWTTQHQSWNLETNGRTFRLAADREHYNARPGSGGGMACWTIYAWEVVGETCRSIVRPFTVYSRPRARAIEAVQQFLSQVTA